MGFFSVKCTVHEFHLPHIMGNKEIQLFKHLLQGTITNPGGGTGKTVGTGKGTSTGGFIIENLLLNILHFLINIRKWQLQFRRLQPIHNRYSLTCVNYILIYSLQCPSPPGNSGILGLNDELSFIINCPPINNKVQKLHNCFLSLTPNHEIHSWIDPHKISYFIGNLRTAANNQCIRQNLPH